MNRPPLFIALTVAAVLFLAFLPSADAASRALIVTGLAGSSANTEEFARLAGQTKDLLIKRGIPASNVEVLAGKVTREAILERLRGAAEMKPDDEFWLVLYGHSGRSQERLPAFQVSGPRFTAEDLEDALDAIPARQFVFIGTSNSGGFLPFLQNPRRAALSATMAEGEGGQPRLPEFWVKAFAENPQAPFPEIASRAAALVDEEYVRSNLAQAEHSRLADPATGKILAPPFAEAVAAAAEPAPAPGVSLPLISASDITVEIRNPKAEWEQQPATAETRKIMEEARQTPNPEGHSALVLRQGLQFTVEDDRTTDRFTYFRVYIARDEAVKDWANQFLPQSPPAVTTKLEMARVIQPDGTSTAFNPARLPGATDPTAGTCCPMVMVYLPNARGGCVIEMAYRTRQILNAALPHVSEDVPIQRGVPAVETEIEVRVPEKPLHRVALRNLGAQAAESSEHGRRVYRWKLKNLPAAESLPGDPPPQLWLASIGISSLPSWDDFAAWYRRLAQGSDAVDDSVRKTAKELAAGAKSRTDIIRRDFEFVSALRYVAIEMGIQGFRPRTPAEVLANRFGDCKDKANLLVALLKCQGIDGRFVLVNRGSATDVNFPSWQFNHAICYVPADPAQGQPQDLWLDATDSVTPFGFVPPGDYGRAGLVFHEEKTEFKTVAGGAGTFSEIRDEWTLRQGDNGGWQGSFHRQTTGLADDALRRSFSSLTPAQRDVAVHALLARLWEPAEFSQGRVSDTSTLAQGMEVRAEVSGPDGVLPRPEVPGLEIFSAPERNRPLWLNDAQPMAFTQIVTLSYAKAVPKTLPDPWQAEAAGQKLGITWERVDDRTVRRVSRVELPQPIVPAEQYGDLRAAVRKWTAALRQTITL